MGEPVAGKFLLEILTKGMYSNPMHVYREYIQNSTDSIDKAIADGILSTSEAAIHIQIDGTKRKITIRDNGCGISKNDLPRVREKFYKANNSQRGSGIGLAVADEIIKMHDGKMLIESKIGSGTTTTLILPRKNK